MGTGSFPGVKRPGHGADHPPPPKRRGHERVELYLYSPSGHSWPVMGRTLFNTLVFSPIYLQLLLNPLLIFQQASCLLTKVLPMDTIFCSQTQGTAFPKVLFPFYGLDSKSIIL